MTTNRLVWGAVVVACGLSALAASARVERIRARARAEQARADALPRTGGREGYATSDSCRGCHRNAHDSWHRSHHRTMTQVATPGAVLGAFDGQVLDEAGHRVGRDGESVWVEQPDDSGRVARHTVALVTGSHHMQVYWIPAASSDRLVAFGWAWLVDEQSWVPNEATLLRPPDAQVEYTWNRVCIKCHVVAGSPGWDEAREEVVSEVAELGIACEACHGPGHAHAERHRDPLARYLRHQGLPGSDDIVHPERMSAAASSELCGQCHSITFFHDDDAWVRSGHAHPPPAPMSAWGRLVRHPLRADQPWIDAVLDDNPDFFAERFWPDGMVRVSGREYNGLVESACHERAELSCISCHSMHDAPPDDQLRPEATGDAVCSGCHPSVAQNVVAHTRHAPGTSSPGCYDCHMPHTTYGLLKAIRSHEIDSPAVQVSVDTGRPNACNLCHLDRTLAWTAEHLSRWYGHPAPDPLPAEEQSAALRWLLAGDAGQRALLAWHFAWAPAHAASGRGWQARHLELLLDDPYAAVRLVAARSLRRLAVLERAVGSEPPRAERAQVLYRPDGSFDAEAARDLSATRDDRAVSLAE